MAKNHFGKNGNIYGEYIPEDENAPKYEGHNFSFHYYISPYYLFHKDIPIAVPKPRSGAKLNMDLRDFLSDELLEKIDDAKEIVFHSLGDTGRCNQRKGVNNEESVADAMSRELHEENSNPPAFLFHLGDLVYYLGQSQYYYEQFYDPFSNYDRPIFAIPGNHDGSSAERNVLGEKEPLGPFLKNFCSKKPIHAPDAGGVARTTMTQPGVYFTLDAPYVSIIGLYTNCLEGPGVISSEGGDYPKVTDQQLAFLTSELKRLAPQRKAGKRAIIIATHAPFYSAISGVSSQGMINDLEKCCEEAGIYPDVLLAGHIHIYSRNTLTLPSGKEIPTIISGSGGYELETPPPSSPPAGTVIGPLTVNVPYIRKYGYLKLKVNEEKITIGFYSPTIGGAEELDSVTVDLKTERIV
ncbi:MAG: hypothetical protein FJZ56_05110 [Chlamydiae bacterium]|nr:hypothetical protein [Chlamydiota bacterium]